MPREGDVADRPPAVSPVHHLSAGAGNRLGTTNSRIGSRTRPLGQQTGPPGFAPRLRAQNARHVFVVR